MSILIKGMDMPKDGRYTMCVTHDDDGKQHIVIQNQDTLEFIKHGGVVEVQTPHGNLIDIDLVMNMLKTEKILIHRIAGKTEIPFYRLEDLVLNPEYVVIERENEAEKGTKNG